MAKNLWYAFGYGAFLLGAITDVRRSARAAKAPPALAGAGGSKAKTVTYPPPQDVLPGENQRAMGALARADAILEKATLHTVRNIDERVSHIKRRINDDSLKPEVREAAAALVSRKCGTRAGVRWCITPKDYGQEIRAIYDGVQQAKSPIALRYVRDHVKVDQFTAANKLLRLRAGDCDDGTILLGSMLQSIGYPVRMRVIQDVNSASWSHIYLLVGVEPSRPSVWVPLDWSVYPFRRAGWQAPGADECALTGRPHGVVARVKDYTV